MDHRPKSPSAFRPMGIPHPLEADGASPMRGGRGSSPGDDPPFWVAGPGLNVQMIYIFFNSAWQFNYIINHFIVNNI